MLTYKILENLPPVPKKLDEIVSYLQNTKLNQTAEESLSKYYDVKARELLINGKTFETAKSVRLELGVLWENWVKTNIHPEYLETGINFTTNGQYHGAHMDSGRNYILIYLIESGGTKVDTVFYQENGYPIERPRITDYDPYHLHDYADLTEIDRVEIPLRKWIMLNTRIIHGVEGIESTRIAYQIGFDKNIFYSKDIE
jgi:hypothetical protein